MWKQRKIEYVDSREEINKIISEAEKYTYLIYGDWEKKDMNTQSLALNSWVKDKMVNVEITTKWASRHFGQACTYIFRKDGQKVVNVQAINCYKELQRYYKLPDFAPTAEKDEDSMWLKLTDTGKFVQSAGPLVGNDGTVGEDYCYVYDLNSAYANVLMNYIPDTKEYRCNDFVGEGEVGFMLDDKLSMVDSGWADVIFKLMDSPYKDFVMKYYEIKKNLPKGDPERDKAKAVINLAIGMLQRHNPFVRAYVVHSCNKYIEDRLDENSFMWNTDAIYSRSPRPDLELGDNIGCFKLEYEGMIKHKGNVYQYANGEVHYKGTPTSWFGTDYDLLEDERPEEGNIFIFNKETNRVEVTKYGL